MRKRCSLAHKAITTLLIPSLFLTSCQTTSPVQEVTVHQASGSTDTDCDGIADNLELQYGFDPNNPDDAELDPDHDDVPSVDELRFGADPTNPDSDGDGVRDDVDLQAGTDLDGDGMPAPFDNCPLDPNKSQADRDGDGHGDACDSDLPSVRIAEAFARLDKDYALLPLAGGKASRATTDRAELMPMPSSFRLWANATKALGGTAPLYELYYAPTKDHAYVNNDLERIAYVRKGYRDLGSLGFVNLKPFTGSVVVRRFVSGTQEAVTIDAPTAQSLITAGFIEKAALGYAMVDGGHLRRPRSVMRYQRSSVFRHQATPLTVVGYASNGARFRVLPEKVANSVPLFRLRNAVLDERLSTDSAEIATYVSQGYGKDGVIGWIMTSPTAMPTQTTAELWRLERSTAHRYSADSVEISGLVAHGWIKTKLLGYAFAGIERAATCAGPTPVARLEDKLRGMASDPEGRAQATLTAIVASCAVERVLAGNVPANVLEKAIADKLPADPEARRRMQKSVARWHGIDPVLRAQSLGRFQSLDPGACTTPINVDRLRDAVHDVVFAYSGTPPSLREPFCDGTHYAPGDPSVGTTRESRAVTVDAKPVGEFGDSNAANPRLAGVLASEFVRGHSAAAAYANSHPDDGYMLSGIPTGLSCSPSLPCVASQGLRCVSGQCYAYPIVRNLQIHTFTGRNFWDVTDGAVLFRDALTNQESRMSDEIFSNEPNDPVRCSPYGPTNRAQIENPLSLTAGKFYEVEVINKNGRYYEHAETVPPDDTEARANGRTIHVCWSPTDPDRPADTITDCSRVRTVEAACTLDGPTCSAATGGEWGLSTGQAARSLELCEQDGLACGETPSEFSSRPAQADARQYIYVETAAPVKKITTSLQDVHCHNETGWDWTGSDELAVSLTAVVGSAQAPGQPPVSVSSDMFQHSYDSDDNHTQLRQELTSVDVSEAGDPFTGRAGYLLTLMEDDDALWSALAGIAIIGAVVLAAVLIWPVLANPAAAAGVAVLLATAWGLISAKYGGDDPLGHDSWSASISDVTDRGAMSHDLMYNPLPQLPGFANVSSQYRGAYDVSIHPAVDGLGRLLNSEITGIECTTSSDCGSGEQCAIGLCVPSGWYDHEPGSAVNPPGFLERREFLNGDSFRYDLYFSWRVTQ